MSAQSREDRDTVASEVKTYKTKSAAKMNDEHEQLKVKNEVARLFEKY